MKILVVEDEPRTAQALELGLTECGYEVTVTHRGDDAVELICTSAFDAVVMDIMLPGIDGLTAVRTLRQRSNSTPILLLSARGEVNQRIEGLNTGADDYVSKPFAMGEIVARLQALTRRDELDPAARLTLFRDLADSFRATVPYPPDISESLTDEQYIRNVVDILYRPKNSS